MSNSGVSMSDNPYDFNYYYEELITLAERLKPDKMKSYALSIQILLLYILLVLPFFFDIAFLSFIQQMVGATIGLTVFILGWQSNENTVKKAITTWIKEDNYDSILTLIISSDIIKKSKWAKNQLDLILALFIFTIAYILYDMNLFLYINYLLSFSFFMFSYAVKSYFLTSGLLKYKELFKECLREQNIDIQDIVPKAEDWIINRKVNE